ncbi:MAG: hypothetical protein A2156_08135 [Deltaproteobacteria bacterium RBG_16_48_10]|nr:MAG: hypothetical protein A2156_08135 [Deltaproteobacteria bacterium RBG_16_48_10]
MIVNPIGQELPLRAANPIPSVAVLNSQRLVKPSFSLENAHKALQDMGRSLFLRISKRYVSGFHITPCFFDRKGSRIQNPVPQASISIIKGK